MAQGKTIAERLVAAMGELKALDEDLTIYRLQRAFISIPSMQGLRDNFLRPEDGTTWDALTRNYPKKTIEDYFNRAPPESSVFDAVDRSCDIDMLGNSSMAYVMSKISDPWGFNTLCQKTVAEDVHNQIIDSLMPSLYAEHINRHLFDKQLDPLEKLRSDPEVVEQFKAIVTSDFFDPLGARDDLLYPMTLLFVYEYFDTGPAYRANRDPLRISSLPIVEAWSSKLSKPSDTANMKLAKYCYVTGGAFSPQGKASATVREAHDALASVPADNNAVTQFHQLLAQVDPASTAGTIFDDSVVNQFQCVSHIIWTKWRSILDDQTPSTFWQAGIRNAQGKYDSSEQPIGPAIGVITSTVTTTVHAPVLASWCAANSGASYMSQVNVGQLKNVVHKVNPVTVWMPDVFPDQSEGPPPVLTCFIAGTQILTDSGSVPIESLREGDRVCTRFEPTQWGVRSCEVVQSPAPEFIYGFNDDAPFFTAGHVFHTTTGLRALRPDIALAENPWIECGQLSVGNRLIRVTAENKYKTIEIRSINSEQTKEQYVYGVHLREGLRSYHANGYLVALNYPEITVSSIAKRLMTLPLPIRLGVLKKAAELQPLFERFGASTILDALEQESKTKSLTFGGKPRPARPFLACDVDMPYVMSFPDSSKNGPQIELLHGVLYVDGKLCEQASFDSHSLSWSRPLPGSDGIWEHAHCTFYHNGQQGFGKIIHKPENEKYSEETIDNEAIVFELTPGMVQPQPYALSSIAKAVQPQLYALSSISKSATPKKLAALAPAARAAARQPVYFALAYDPATYDPSGKTKSKPQVRCGNILLPTEANRFAFGKLALDDYDQVRLKLIEKAKSEKLPSTSNSQAQFYKHTVRYDARQVEFHKFELLQARAMIEASDEFPVWKDANPTTYLEMEPPVKNLHYTNLGMDANFVIPELFRTVELEKSLPDMSGLISFSGLAKTYSSMAEGNEGEAHMIVGTYVKPSTNTRSTAAHDALLTAKSSDAAVTAAHRAPDAITMSLMASSVPSSKEERLQALGNIPLDLTAVNSSAQATMTNIMQWHMRPEERKLFFGAVDKPTDLPPELTTSIENTPEGIWIRDTYARAYICQILTNSNSQIRPEYRFTEQEKKNIKYFWNGSGANCLSKSSVYHKLERAISRYELRKRYDILKVIHEEGSGVVYSNALYDLYTGPFNIDELAKVNPVTGTSFLSKISTIMDALDDGAENERALDTVVDNHKTMTDTNSNHLVLAAMSYQKGDVWLAQFWGLKSDDERAEMLEDSWLEETLRDLIQKLLNQDQTVTGPVLEALSDAMKKYSDEITGWAEMSQQEKLQHIMFDIGDRLKDVMKCVGKLLGWVKDGLKWVWQKGRQIVAAWRGNAAALGDAIDHVMQEKPAGFVKGPLFSGLMFIVGMAAMGVTVWNLCDKWSDSSPSDRGLMLMTVIAALNQMADFGIDAVYSIMRYKKGAFSEAAELAIHAEFDALSGLRLGSKWSSVFEDPLVTGALRIREIEKLEYRVALESQGVETIIRGDQLVDELKKFTPIKRKFNIARSAIAIIGCIVSVGMAIFMTWSLVHDWDKLSKTTRIFQTLLTVLQWIEASVALVVIGGYVAWGVATLAGASAATAIGTFAVAAASVFAAVALVIAVIGVIVLVIWLIVESKTPPPPSELENWMTNQAKPWANSHPAPDDPVKVSLTPNSFSYSSDLKTVCATFANNTHDADVELSSIALKFSSGAGGGAFFADKKQYTNNSEAMAGNFKIDNLPSGCTVRLLNAQNPVVQEHIDTTITLLRPKGDDTTARTFKLGSDKPITITAYGVVRDDTGAPCSMTWRVFTKDDDMTSGQLDATRGKKS